MSKKSFGPEFPGEAWSDYIGYVAGILNLSHWTLHLDKKPCLKAYRASVSPTFGRYHASIYLSRDWQEVAPDEQREAIVHELLHLIIHPLDGLNESLVHVLNNDCFAYAASVYSEQREYVVDALARIISENIAMPAIPQSQCDAGIETPNA